MNTQSDPKATKAAPVKPAPVLFDGIDVVSADIDGARLLFAVDRENDPIQRNHRAGRFYEPKELRYIRRWFPKGGVFVDIGANIGNHSLFVAKFLQPAAVIPFEPNPPAIKLLTANVHLNGMQDMFDLRHLGIGLSAGEATDFAMEKRDANLGGAKMLPGEGDLVVKPGDVALHGVAPAFIKIDVEGMETDVLTGLKGTIGTHRPFLMIEVDVENDAAFRAWVQDNDYVYFQSLKHYKANENHILLPRELAPPRVLKRQVG